MIVQRLSNLAPVVVLVAGALLFVDLFLRWQDVAVRMPMVHVSAGTTGWSGWGVLGGIALVVLVLWKASGLVGGTAPSPFVSATLGAAVAGFVVGRFEDTSANVVVTPVVTVEVAARTWPAYAGLVLALVVAVAAIAPFVLDAATRHPTPHPQT